MSIFVLYELGQVVSQQSSKLQMGSSILSARANFKIINMNRVVIAFLKNPDIKPLENTEVYCLEFLKQGKYILCRNNGQMINTIFDEVVVKGTYIYGRVGNLWGMWGRLGKPILRVEFPVINEVVNNHVVVRKQNEKYSVFNMAYKESMEFDWIEDVNSDNQTPCVYNGKKNVLLTKKSKHEENNYKLLHNRIDDLQSVTYNGKEVYIRGLECFDKLSLKKVN
jgi:hypothetical protein